MDEKLLIYLQDPTLWLALLNDSTCKIRFEIWTEIELLLFWLFISRGKTLFLVLFIYQRQQKQMYFAYRPKSDVITKKYGIAIKLSVKG